MAQYKLNNSAMIWTLAKDLGISIKNVSDPVSEILKYCEKRVRKILKEFPRCKNLAELLDALAGKMNTSFYEIHNDEDLNNLKSTFISKGEKIFANLETEFSDEVLGITFKRLNREPWEHEYISVIDCRGSKGFRSYFTKWHEIAHLLILTNQQRLKFMRTNLQPCKTNPEEAMVDIIAGRFGFYPPFIQKKAYDSDLTFERIDELREELCPEASIHSSLIGFVQAWPGPSTLALCELGLKKNEQALAAQQCFAFKDDPIPLLRATKITSNQAARDISLIIFKNMRVPISSVIYKLHNEFNDYAEAEENLAIWETSSGRKMKDIIARVRVKRYGTKVFALLTPSKHH